MMLSMRMGTYSTIQLNHNNGAHVMKLISSNDVPGVEPKQIHNVRGKEALQNYNEPGLYSDVRTKGWDLHLAYSALVCNIGQSTNVSLRHTTSTV